MSQSRTDRKIVRLEKSLLEYENYRDFLRDYYVAAKSQLKSFSLRQFSEKAGFKSQSVLTQVIEGERNLSPQSIIKFAKALDLKEDERTYFHHLVLLNQSKSVEERQLHAEAILKSRNYQKVHPLREAELACLKQWYYIPIRELAALKDFNEDPHWVSEALNNSISVPEARRALEDLTKLGLLVRDSQGRLRQAQAGLNTDNEVASPFIPTFHKSMIGKALEAIDNIAREKREISSVTVSVTEESALKVKKMIQDFRKQILDVVIQETEANVVYQVNFQFFPISRQGQKGGIK